MSKKRDFASDSDVSRFISRKKNHVDAQDLNTRQQITIYPDKNLLDNVKILAKIKDVNLNSLDAVTMCARKKLPLSIAVINNQTI